jgi:hypothetical protein
VAVLLATTLLRCIGPVAADDGAPIDVDAWHVQLGTADAPAVDDSERQLVLGIYPGLSAVLGLPDVVSVQGNVFVSLVDVSRFTVFLGYGIERGAPADADIVTLGWGGVRSLPTVERQWGFYGKFLRYRRWDDRNHGIHHGLSVGTESGAGYLGLTVELGVARSDRDHWMATAQIAVKVALPIGIPLGSE